MISQINNRQFNVLLVSLTAISLSISPSFASTQPKFRIAQVPEDSYCYFRTSDGRVINVDKLCGVPTRNDPLPARTNNTNRPMQRGNTNRPPAKKVNVEEQFLQNFQNSLNRRLNSASKPSALADLQSNPQAFVNQAKQVCQALRSGTAIDKFAPQGNPKVDALYSLAPKYFCPEFHD